MTDDLTQKDRRALGLPRDEGLTWADVFHAAALGVCVGAAVVLLVAVIMIWAALQ